MICHQEAKTKRKTNKMIDCHCFKICALCFIEKQIIAEVDNLNRKFYQENNVIRLEEL